MVKMLAVISPAKTLDFESDAPVETRSNYRFSEQSQTLIDLLKEQSVDDIKKLMKISDKLSQLNVDRYHAWQPTMTKRNSKQALFAFQGDVYAGLSANTLTEDDIRRSQNSLRILSGLYGLLRPFDAIQPYRLEMGTQLKNAKGRNLYQFWGDQITEALADDVKALNVGVVINLASHEYFKAVRPSSLEVPVINPVFLDEKNGQFKIISFYAKKARGLMARFIIEKNPVTLSELKAFNYAGYYFVEKESDELTWVFKRDEQPTNSKK